MWQRLIYVVYWNQCIFILDPVLGLVVDQGHPVDRGHQVDQVLGSIMVGEGTVRGIPGI